MADSPWPAVHAERKALADDLANLTAQGWRTPSLCARGLTLRATDTDWTRGSGPLVEGPAISLLMAATGRTVALDDLAGPGVETLRSR
jgi:hypothetical protein